MQDRHGSWTMAIVTVKDYFRFGGGLILHGLGTGIIGALIALLIRTVQEVAYGASKGGFLEIASEAPPWRRLACVVVGGLFGAFSWYGLRGGPYPIVGVEASISQGKKMPPVITTVNGMIQDIVVALGGSFGREAAPREIAGMWAGALGDFLGLEAEERSLYVACGAGAGLAAVYSVPISGALYTIEHILKWNCTAKNVIAAVVTSAIGTVVAMIEVEAKALYEMPKFSYCWPSWKMMLWSVIIGPISGLGAMFFRRLIKFVEKFKPRNRFSTDFDEVLEDQKVRRDGKWGKVIDKSTDDLVVQWNDTGERETFVKEKWGNEKIDSERDWRILVAMPTIFLALGVVSEKMPSLLGNGRALAQVAIERERSTELYSILLIMKVIMTAGSIGSGAAGGTLTPSVAIGATFGAIIGEEFQFYAPSLAPMGIFDAPMSIIAAASFLSVAMTSPVTGLWLLVEFSGQGISREHIWAALRYGDFSGIMASHAAAGMLVPMITAVALGTYAVKAAGNFWDFIRPPPPKSTKPPSTPRPVSHDLDLPEHDDEDERHIHLSYDEIHGLFICFRAGLITNTLITVCMGSALLVCPEKVTRVSMYGILASLIAGIIGWIVISIRSKGNRAYTQMRQTGTELHIHPEEDSELHHHHYSSHDLSHDCRHNAYGGVCAVALAVLGSLAPLTPWVTKVWDINGDIYALVAVMCSALGAVAFSSCVHIFFEPHLHAVSGKEVIFNGFLICLICALFSLFGVLFGRMDWFLNLSQCHD